MTQKKDIGKILRQFGLVFVALFIIVFMSIKSDVFLTSQNIINILRQISINGILAVGMTFVILTGGIDLSVGSVVAITGVIVGSLLQSGTNWFLASLAALVVSAICGVFNGWLISYVGFQPFIATLSTMTIGRGFAQVYSNGKPYTISDPSFKVIGQGYFLGIPVPIILLVIFCIIGLVILTMTTFGRYVFAIGGNMIKESLGEEENVSNDMGFKSMLLLAIATSIDALAVGITFAFLNVHIVSAASIIGVCTFLISFAGVKIGNIFGTKYKSKAELAGGVILILLGFKILFEHLHIL